MHLETLFIPMDQHVSAADVKFENSVDLAGWRFHDLDAYTSRSEAIGMTECVRRMSPAKTLRVAALAVHAFEQRRTNKVIDVTCVLAAHLAGSKAITGLPGCLQGVTEHHALSIVDGRFDWGALAHAATTFASRSDSFFSAYGSLFAICSSL